MWVKIVFVSFQVTGLYSDSKDEQVHVDWIASGLDRKMLLINNILFYLLI
jgi:hypothetical protein